MTGDPVSTEEPTLNIPVDASDDVGSQRLAAALAARDVPAIGQALRHDYVVVPITRGPAGDSQIAVFGAEGAGGQGTYELCLFSSAATFSAFVADSAAKEFSLQRGGSLAPFIEQNRATLTRVVFDPAGPHPVKADLDDVLAILEPQPTDDDVAWAAGTTEEPAEQPEGRVVALDLPLNKDWAVIDLVEREAMDKHVRALVKRQMRGLPSSPVLRAQLTRWLGSSARTAAAAGGRFMAFLLRRTEDAAVALNVTMYWHELGPQIGDQSHLQAIIARLRSRQGEGDELAGAESAAGPFVRHTHVKRGASEVGGEGTQVLILDYWLQFPDSRGLALLSFASPHLNLRESLQLLADNVVLSASWMVEPEARPETDSSSA